MAPRLILNADDFGLTRGINRAVAELYDSGAVTSATLMANGPAFVDAVALARMRPGLGVGCHVQLVDGIPLCHAAAIPSLIGADGKTFRPSLPDFLLAVLRGKVSEDDIAREAAAQVQRLQRAGIDVTHLDTHKHTHMLTGVARPLLFVAERAGVGAIRNPFEPQWSRSISPSSIVRRTEVSALERLRPAFEALPQIRRGTVATTSGTAGIAATGRMDAAALRHIAAAVPEGTWELVCHPGHHDAELDGVHTRLRGSRDVERRALQDVFPHLSGLELIHYGNLGSLGALRGLPQYTQPTGHETIL